MKFSYEWLQSFFDTELPSPSALAELVERYSFEVEALEGEGKEAVLDIKVTPNRGSDCFCHRGIAREISAILSIPLTQDLLRGDPTFTPLTQALEVNIAPNAACARYSAALITGVKVGPSPEWLAARLRAIGQRPINNVVDATNYVMFELGQPLHAFDAHNLERGATWKIGVRTAHEGEKIQTLDKVTHTLTSQDLLIVDDVKNVPIGIAGVKGGQAAEIGNATTTIIVESANFNSISVRKTSQRLKLRTDASVRFENGISPELTAYALKQVVALVHSLARGELEGYVDVYPEPALTHKPVSVTEAGISRLLGVTISRAEIGSVLTRLDLPFVDQGQVFMVTPPFERDDLVIPEDIIEEVGRIYGFDRIEPAMLHPESGVKINKTFFYTEKIRTALQELGFSEVFTSSFRDAGDRELANALASDKGFLRKNLTENLAEVVERNVHNTPLLGLSEIKIFEIGKVFPIEGERLSLGLAVWTGRGKEATRAKEVVTAVTQSLSQILQTDLKWSSVGMVVETNLEAVFEKLPMPISYREVPKRPDISYQSFSPYPFIVRDIALFVPKETLVQKISDVITVAAGHLLVRVDHFDTFTKSTEMSHAFRLVLQAKDRTLTDQEANEVTLKVHAALREEGWTIR